MQTVYPWQVQSWQKVLAALRQNRMPHAMLLSGISGLGKDHFAKLLAKRLLCDSDPSYKNDYACGQCRGCHLFEAATHPDYYYLAPQEKSNSIKVQQLRDLIEKFATVSHQHRYRIAIINPADAMNRMSANALLKILEEPPGLTLFLLVTHHMKALPSTILSRCQKIYFSIQDPQPVFNWIESQLPANIDAQLLLKLADFAPLRTLQLAEENYLQIRDQILQALNDISNKIISPISAAHQLKEENIITLVCALISLLVDLTRLHYPISKHHIVNSDCCTILEKIASKTNLHALFNFLTSVQENYRMLIANVPLNKELLLERLLIEWSDVCSLIPIAI